MSAAKRAKNVPASIFFTCSTGGLVSRFGVTAPEVGVEPVSQRPSGVAVSPAWNTCTESKSAGPFVWVRPIIQPTTVGARTSVVPAGSEPRHPGPTIANSCSPLPVVRVPGDAKTSVHRSSMGSR